MTHAIDIHVGKKIRQRRRSVGMTQREVAEELGLTTQQVQKYEVGKSKISAARLWEVARALSVPVSYFFEGIGNDASGSSNVGSQEQTGE